MPSSLAFVALVPLMLLGGNVPNANVVGERTIWISVCLGADKVPLSVPANQGDERQDLPAACHAAAALQKKKRA